MQTLTHTPVPTPPAPAGPRRRTMITAVAVVAVLLLAALGALVVLAGSDGEPERAGPARSTTVDRPLPSTGSGAEDAVADAGAPAEEAEAPISQSGTPTTLTTSGPTIGGTSGGGTSVGGTSGGGSQPTAPPTTAPQAPPTTQAPAPQPPAPQPPAPEPTTLVLTKVEAPANWSCGLEAPEQDPKTQLTLEWHAVGAVSVSVSIDSPNGVFADELPTSGSLVVPAPCGEDTNTYYVTAHAADGRTTTQSVTTMGFD